MIPTTGTRTGSLPAGIVDVWRIALDPPAVPLATLIAALDHDEREQLSHRGPHGNAWATAHGALRCILASYLGVTPAALRFTADADGKPRLAGGHKLEFSLSRGDTLALVAVASDRAVGVDVERVRDDVDIDAVTRDFLSGGDAASVSHAPANRRREVFFAAWTRHEARLKLRGLGLDSAPFEPPLAPGGLIITRAVAIAPGFAAAVAAEGSGWTVRIRDFPETPVAR